MDKETVTALGLKMSVIFENDGKVDNTALNEINEAQKDKYYHMFLIPGP